MIYIYISIYISLYPFIDPIQSIPGLLFRRFGAGQWRCAKWPAPRGDAPGAPSHAQHSP